MPTASTSSNRPSQNPSRMEGTLRPLLRYASLLGDTVGVAVIAVAPQCFKSAMSSKPQCTKVSTYFLDACPPIIRTFMKSLVTLSTVWLPYQKAIPRALFQQPHRWLLSPYSSSARSPILLVLRPLHISQLSFRLELSFRSGIHGDSPSCCAEAGACHSGAHAPKAPPRIAPERVSSLDIDQSAFEYDGLVIEETHVLAWRYQDRSRPTTLRLGCGPLCVSIVAPATVDACGN